ncbi:phage tail assembly chaperone [Pseudomonas putida]|uniref:Phage tail assembly chaperone-like domain-containing protein n=1 Tax=Pseudomonas putida TaxID=303 RepID=A0A1Q9R8H7_PSEPU|nr:phage tail assembly chaperone [Pseudomonas putida]OLS63729.1 hypothetical protein PSEMO_12960 [Pseudomonas putida]
MKKYIVFDESGALEARLLEGIHTIPVGAVPVTDELWNRTIQELDGVWKIDDNGLVIKDIPLVVIDQAALERAWRDRRIEDIKWLRERHRDEQDLQMTTTLTSSKFLELLAYMQALRDWPQSTEFPDQTERPVAPAWLTDDS